MSGATDERAINLTDGALLLPLLSLAWPIVLSQLLQVGYNLADTFWVGQLGQDAVAALALSWPLVFLLISIGGGLGIAGSVLVAQNKGAGNDDRIDHVAGQTLSSVALVAAAFSVVGYFLAPTLLALIGAEPGTTLHRLSLEYTRTIFLGVPFVFGFFIFQSLLRGFGDTRTPLYLMGFGVALNVLLDPFLIMGFEGNLLLAALGLEGLEASAYAATGFAGLGVQGAAVATIFSRGLGAAIGLGLLLSGRIGIQLSVEDLWLRLETVTKLVRVGAPASVEQSTRALGVTAMTALVALVGDPAVGAFGIGNRILSLVFLPALGISRAAETAVGQNLGADQPDRARNAVFISSGLLAAGLVVVSVAAYVFAAPIIDVFIAGDGSAAVIDIGTAYLRIIGPTFVALGVFRVVSGGFRGAGSTRTAMAFAILSLWVFRIPPAYAAVAWFDAGASGIWTAIAFSNVVTVVLAGAWFLRGTWTDNVVDEGPPVDVEGGVDDADGTAADDPSKADD